MQFDTHAPPFDLLLRFALRANTLLLTARSQLICVFSRQFDKWFFDLIHIMLIGHIIPLLALAGDAWAGTIAYDWDITWVSAAPDGFTRPVIGVNGVWPCPMIVATAGDTIVINLTNKLGNETTGLHFHGMTQYGSPDMDGPVGATQCAVPPGSSVQYSFVVCSISNK